MSRNAVTLFQIMQRIRSGRDAAVLPSADPAKFYSLLGVGAEETGPLAVAAAWQG